MPETWKTVLGYEGLYEVSNLGRVKSLSRIRPGTNQQIKESFLKINTDRNGYKRVKLSKEKIAKNVLLHRLVAKGFIENPNNKREVNHIDGDKNNNLPENLEWVSRSENMKHAFANNLIKARKGIDNNKTKLDIGKVRNIRNLREKGHTLWEIANLYGITAANVSEIVNFKTWKEVR